MQPADRYRSARWKFAGVILALGLASLAYRVLHVGHLQQTAALFVGLPTLLAAAITLWVRTGSLIGLVMKTITLGLLLSGPVLGEGFVCVLFAAPLFYLVGFVAAATIQIVDARAGRRDRGTAGLVLLPALLLSLEGALPGLSFPRQNTAVVERVVDAAPERVEASLAGTPHFETEPLPLFLQVGFPRPIQAAGAGLTPGDQRVVTFGTPRGGRRELVLEVAAREPGFVRFRAVSDATKIADWLGWDTAEVTWMPDGDGRTRVRWVQRYERRLDPAWYFSPLQAIATTQVAEYLIRSVASPLD
jgi:hypothetical protein